MLHDGSTGADVGKGMPALVYCWDGIVGFEAVVCFDVVGCNMGIDVTRSKEVRGCSIFVIT